MSLCQHSSVEFIKLESIPNPDKEVIHAELEITTLYVVHRYLLVDYTIETVFLKLYLYKSNFITPEACQGFSFTSDQNEDFAAMITCSAQQAISNFLHHFLCDTLHMKGCHFLLKKP